MATLLTLRQLVSRRLDQALVSNDIPASGVFWTRAEVNDWINEAARQVYAEVAEIESQTLVTETDGAYTASARSVSLQTLLGITDDPLKIEEVRDVTNASATDRGILIPHVHHRNVPRFQNGVEADIYENRGRTTRTWDWRSHNPMRIEIDPVPTTALTLRVRYVPAVPATLTADGDTPSWLPTAHHELLVLYAVVQAKQKEESDWRPEWNLYQEKLGRFRDSAEERQAQSSRPTFREDLSIYASRYG